MHLESDPIREIATFSKIQNVIVLRCDWTLICAQYLLVSVT